MSSRFGMYLEDIVRKKENPEFCYETLDFQKVKDYVLSHMLSSSSKFSLYFNRDILFGPAAHKTRIDNDYEYEVLLELKVPDYHQINICKRHKNIGEGYISLDVSNINNKLPMEDRYQLINRKHLQNWLGNIFRNAFDGYDIEICGPSGYLYELSYEEGEIWHIVHAHSEWRDFDICFLPAVKIFQSDQAIHAIPDLMTDCSSNHSFMLINTNSERQSLQKENVRKALILMQVLCDAKGLEDIQYFHLSNLVIGTKIHLSNGTLEDVFIELLNKLCEALYKKHLGYAFDDRINLLSEISYDELEDYERKLNGAYDTLRSYKHQKELSYMRCSSHFKC